MTSTVEVTAPSLLLSTLGWEDHATGTAVGDFFQAPNQVRRISPPSILSVPSSLCLAGPSPLFPSPLIPNPPPITAAVFICHRGEGISVSISALLQPDYTDLPRDNSGGSVWVPLTHAFSWTGREHPGGIWQGEEICLLTQLLPS